ncbi:MAG: 23S rRNA (uracil(1939)-C(5))-methyltransferase RlmD [Clostridia bacterium]|nr:23S rRNA (uracil(1939)-C(5))-methyltransferase RlmD [Clostridia bacterium]
MKDIKKNDILSVEITDLTDLGFGVGRSGGRVIFVADTVPGDVVEARVIKVNASYLVGRVESVKVRSDAFVANRCECGCKSCAYRSISYADEAKLKEEGVRHLFSTEALAGIKVRPIVTSPKETRYRNKAQYPITKTKDGYAVGFFAPKSHRVTPVEDCPLTPAVFSDICKYLCAYFAEENLSVYNETSGEGLLRHIYLRRGEVSGEILLTLVICGDTLPRVEKMAEKLCTCFPDVVGVLLNVNKENTNVVLGDRYITVFGRDHIYDTLGGVRLKITAPAFYQVNRECADLLYSLARELAAPCADDTLLDLYCGAGSIGLSMAKDVRELVGIEIVESAVECAKENASANGITNAHFFTGDAANTERLLDRAQHSLGRRIEPDIVILDPPRAGCDERLLEFVAKLTPKRVVYISCNPKTLARDVARMRALGYDTDSVTPVDMFPMTGHVESLVCLTRQTN